MNQIGDDAAIARLMDQYGANAEIPATMPLIDVLLKLSLLVAALSTVAIFLRLRTASLTEIQLRLAALEEMLASRADVR